MQYESDRKFLFEGCEGKSRKLLEYITGFMGQENDFL